MPRTISVKKQKLSAAEGKTSLTIFDYHNPALPSGSYEIKVVQTVQVGTNPESLFEHTQNFHVAGPRFELNPSDIHAVFPPHGSLGDHSHVLPHVVLNRSTLPWERTADGNNSDPPLPWLCLLLFDDEEKPEPKVVTLEVLKQNNNDETGVKFPKLDLEPGQSDNDKVTVIDVKRSLLEAILPQKNELLLLAHVRRNNTTLDEVAVVIGNRLPKNGGVSTVHLVSIEARYAGEKGFDCQNAGNDDLIRLVSLKSWRFACLDSDQSFTGLLKKLNRDRVALPLPKNSAVGAEKYLSMGYVPLQHNIREGSKTVSWYHGPLLPGKNASSNIQPQLPVRCADELFRFNPKYGMFDVSYAAAWQLGRLLTIQNRHTATAIYNWKKSHAQHLRKKEQKENKAHVHLVRKKDKKPEADFRQLPDAIMSWLRDLSALTDVPFNYLIQDERMLPKESIRFFMVDPYWISCLLDGALSIGRITVSDHAREKEAGILNSVGANQPVSGFMMRSEVVTGWPGLIVDAYAKDENKLELLRMDRLSQNVLLVLFGDVLETVDICLKPETLHFGFKHSDDNENGVVNISDLAEQMSANTSGQFASQMIEAVEGVRFKLNSKNLV